MAIQAKVRKDSFSPLPLHMSHARKAMAKMMNRLTKLSQSFDVKYSNFVYTNATFMYYSLRCAVNHLRFACK